MVRVKIFEPKLKTVQKGKSIETVIENKKEKFVKETSVIDSVWDAYERAGDDGIIQNRRYMEKVEVKKKAKKDVPKVDLTDEQKTRVDTLVKETNREDLNELAKESGVEEPENLKDKTAVAVAIVLKEAEEDAE